MSKIIAIQNGLVTIGHDDGTLVEAKLEDCTFSPSIGDHVEIFQNTNKMYVNKVFRPTSPTTPQPITQPYSDTHAVMNYAMTSDTPQHVVSQGVYVLLACLLGGLGVHKFYSGHFILGIVYILFFWTTIPYFIALIEAIIAAVKTPDCFGKIEA